MLYTYGVTPLKSDNFEARCEDIINQVKSNVIMMPLFSMTLTPEGNPVWDKAGKMCSLYAKYREALEGQGVNCGILVQASMGHGYDIIPNPFQKYVGIKDGKESFVCCPEDENFVNHFCEVLKTLAKEKPAAIMLDDDFRLMMRPGRGCACPLHMKEFNARTGLNMTREELTEHIYSHSDNDLITDVFRDIQRDSLVKLAKAFREAIDSVDPSIQGINCTSGHICENVMHTNKIFAGKDNPTIVRVPNGIYAPEGIRGFSDLMCQASICSAKLKKAGIDIILSETDTIPFNRYGKSARYLHAHFAASVLEGLKGAKHWLTRSSAFETESGKAYRKILSENYGLYEKLASLSEEIKWIGCGHGYIEQEKVMFNRTDAWRYHTCTWITKVMERIGLPFYFTEDGGKAVFLEDSIGADMTDEQIKKVFEGSVFMTAQVAEDLIKRGYGNLLGVKIEEWNGGAVSGESFDGTINMCCTKQKNLKNIKIVNNRVEILSHNYLRKDGKAELLSPAVTVYRRDGGALSVVYCGTPDAEFNYMEGFAFLNETRKEQFISLLKEADALPVYCHGDEEICLRAGYLNDGALLAAIFEIGIDPMDSITLYLEKKPSCIAALDSDGKENIAEFEDIGNNMYNVKVRIETLNPVILIIR